MNHYFSRLRAAINQPTTRKQRVWLIGWIVLLSVLAMFFTRFHFAINLSPSLPGKLYLVERGTLPARGDLAEFRFDGAVYTRGTRMVKRAAGVGGSLVDVAPLPDGRMELRVDGAMVGVAKRHASSGRPLTASKPRVLDADEYYMAATHPDSFDSRYVEFGAVKREQIIGRAIEVF
jgi:conjugal transfer pilin signal peptidase TrbI